MSTPHYKDGTVTLHHGNALHVASKLERGSVQSIITSPPYFGLRDYDEPDQFGAEPTVAEFVGNLVALFRELREVLADDGTLWLNLGDSYSSAGGMQGVGKNASVGSTLRQASDRTRPQSDLPVKNLLGVPWRVAFALQDDGWILRSDVIWHKTNPMPESVTDRPTKAHEYLFLFAKSPRYYYDALAIAEAATGNQSNAALSFVRESKSPLVPGHKEKQHRLDRSEPVIDGMRNKRSVWSVPTVPFGAAHFAVYPPELIRPCILAGSRPGDTILDPFSGSGTTGMVATQEGRKYVGIDLNKEYLDMSLRTRFAQPPLDFGGAA